MKYYLCKFIPPRANFLATMTPDERELMEEHGKFLDNLLGKGLIVAHGPVIDESGGYGVSLYQVADDQDDEFLLHDSLLEGPVVEHEPIEANRADAGLIDCGKRRPQS